MALMATFVDAQTSSSDDNVYSVIGTIVGNWDTDIDMAEYQGSLYIAVIDGVSTGNYEFKIRKNHDWTINIGADSQIDGANLILEVTKNGSTVVIFFNSVGYEITYEVYDEGTYQFENFNVWTLAGDSHLLGSDWNILDTKNDMFTLNGEDYILIKYNLTLPEGTYYFKVFEENSQTESYPSNNASLVIDENATYTIIFTFNSKTKELSATATKTDGLFFNYIPKGNVAELIQNPNKYKGTVIIPLTVTHDGQEYTVAKICDNAFSGCSGLTSVTIPSSVTTIGYSAFSGCSGLTSLTIPSSVTSIGDNAFNGCKAIRSIDLPPNSISSIGEGLFSDCSGLTSVTIPNNVTSIGNSAFSGCSRLTSLSIPNSVTSIGRFAFFGCSSLTSLNVPSSVTKLYSCVFSGCSALSSITIPNSVTSIGESAFNGCSKLTSITIGEGVRSIDSNAFTNCKQLTDVYCLAENVPNTNSDAFNDSYIEYATLHVPSASLNNYKNAEPWKNFKNKVALSGEDIPETPKCAKPTITYNNGVITFSCETEGVEFISEVKANDNKKEYNNKIILSNTYTVSVYATKTGYDNSETVTMEVIGTGGILGDLTGDGKVDVADHVKLSNIIMNK